MKVIDLHSFVLQWQHLKGRTFYVACSGGVDSVVLAHLAKELSSDVILLHVNYQLRGEDSMLDRDFVLALGRRLNVRVEVKEFDTNQYLIEKGGNLQELARKVRYDFFNQYLSHDKDAFLLLGHHSDDQVETFFQHVARKSGVLGMACMLESDANILRPLLSYSKDEIYQLAKIKGWAWREDTSNQSNKYTRNKLRNILIPEMENEVPTLKNSVLTLIEAFQNTQKHLEIIVRPILTKIEKLHFLSFEDFDSLSMDECICLFQFKDFPVTVVKELYKLRYSQKGKSISFGNQEIVREELGFMFVSEQDIDAIPQIVTEVVDRLPEQFPTDELYLDVSKIRGELRLRYWEVGDRISPIGMKGSKLISDVLTDAKIASYKRKKSLVVVDDEKVIWCVGIKISRFIQVTEKTEQIARITLNY